jgi:hypothetical protein
MRVHRRSVKTPMRSDGLRNGADMTVYLQPRLVEGLPDRDLRLVPLFFHRCPHLPIASRVVYIILSHRLSRIKRCSSALSALLVRSRCGIIRLLSTYRANCNAGVLSQRTQSA